VIFLLLPDHISLFPRAPGLHHRMCTYLSWTPQFLSILWPFSPAPILIFYSLLVHSTSCSRGRTSDWISSSFCDRTHHGLLDTLSAGCSESHTQTWSSWLRLGYVVQKSYTIHLKEVWWADIVIDISSSLPDICWALMSSTVVGIKADQNLWAVLQKDLLSHVFPFHVVQKEGKVTMTRIR
jgi:hypothetical protein